MTNNQVDDVVNFFAGFRKELGKDVEIGLECHAHYDTETGIQICNQIEPYRPLWVEEPVPSDNVESMLRIRNNTRVPIAAGENIYTRYGFRPFLEKQALSIIQPDFTKTGGLMEGLKIANMAETYNIPLAPHGVCTPLGTLGITHVCARDPQPAGAGIHPVSGKGLHRIVRSGEAGCRRLPARARCAGHRHQPERGGGEGTARSGIQDAVKRVPSKKQKKRETS